MMMMVAVSNMALAAHSNTTALFTGCILKRPIYIFLLILYVAANFLLAPATILYADAAAAATTQPPTPPFLESSNTSWSTSNPQQQQEKEWRNASPRLALTIPFSSNSSNPPPPSVTGNATNIPPAIFHLSSSPRPSATTTAAGGGDGAKNNQNTTTIVSPDFRILSSAILNATLTAIHERLIKDGAGAEIEERSRGGGVLAESQPQGGPQVPAAPPTPSKESNSSSPAATGEKVIDQQPTNVVKNGQPSGRNTGEENREGVDKNVGMPPFHAPISPCGSSAGGRLDATNVTIFIPQLSIVAGQGVVLPVGEVRIQADRVRVTRRGAEEEEEEINRNSLNEKLAETKQISSASATQHSFHSSSAFSAAQLFDYPELAQSVDTRLDPCDDFYEFVCSGWRNSNSIHDDRPSVNQFGIVAERIKVEIKEILDDKEGLAKELKNLSEKIHPPIASQISLLYNACMDNTSRMAVGAIPLLEQLAAIKRSRLHYLTDWLVVVFPAALFYSLGVGPDLNDTTRNQLVVQPLPLFFGSEKYYIEEQFSHHVDGLRNYLAKVLELLAEDSRAAVAGSGGGGAAGLFSNISPAEIQRRVDAFIAVETAFALIQNNTDKHWDDAYADDADMTVQELQDDLATTINWVRYLHAILPSDLIQLIVPPSKSGPPNGVASLKVHISGVSLIRQLEVLARNLSGQVLADFMDWRVILNEVPNLDDRYLDASLELDRLMQGTISRRPADEECRISITSMFSPLIERVYVRRFFDAETRPQMAEMFHTVRDSFGQMLETNEWMDAGTKREALAKLAKLSLVVGYADSVFNDSKMAQQFAEFSLGLKTNDSTTSDKSYARMMRDASLWSIRRNMYQLAEPVEIEFPAYSVNGFYYPVRNAIVLTAGLLQGVFYNSTRPMPLNYGSIGAVLAHETTHGYDNAGRLHDGDGRVRDWWANSTRENFNKAKQCFIEQYSSIEVPSTQGLHINGELTQGENIADNGGMRAAYTALERFLGSLHSMEEMMSSGRAAATSTNNNILEGGPIKGETDAQAEAARPHLSTPTTTPQGGEERRLRGLEQFNSRQLFFLSYAFSWCTKQRPEAAIFAALNDNHSPPDVRVNLVLSNLPQFAEVFSCPAGSPMNPPERCSVW